MPITKIPNTNLFTGIFYKLVLKSLPGGFVTWADVGKYYAQYELTPNELPKYETGGPYQFDHQWVFGATESTDGYTLANRAKPFSNLIWTNAEVGHGNHVAIYDDEEARCLMSAGGKWRKDASWIVQPTNEQNYYKVENLARRSNYLTWTWTKRNDFNYYLQLCQDFEEDSKLSFQPVGIKLDAFVYDFEFSNLDCILNNNENDKTLEFTKTDSNPSNDAITSTLDSVIKTTDSLAISFDYSTTLLDKTSFSINEIGIKGISFDGGFDANVERKIEITKTTTLKKDILIPPRKTVQSGIFMVWANDVELPFTAKMKIVGRADRVVAGQPDQTREGSVPPEVVEQYIKSSGEQMEFISTSGVTIVRVSGVLKGNFGIKVVVGTKSSG